jgi:hypothetical protein
LQTLIKEGPPVAERLRVVAAYRALLLLLPPPVLDRLGQVLEILRQPPRLRVARKAQQRGLAPVLLRYLPFEAARGKPSGPLLGNGWPRRPRAFRSLT